MPACDVAYAKVETEVTGPYLCGGRRGCGGILEEERISREEYEREPLKR